MGRRGPAPTPTALKVVKGERRDRVNSSEPEPDERPIVAPGWLSAEAVEVWDEYAGDLARKRVLTSWDLEAFGSWCDAVVRRRHASAHLDAEGEVTYQDVFNRNGEITGQRYVKSPWMQVWKDANEVVARVGARFGLTPSDRSQLKVGSDGKPSEKGAERLLS